MSVARAREFVARARTAGIVVHELGGWGSRGNGQSSAYEGWVNHHTATGFGMAPSVLWNGRSDLAGPLCNTSGNADGSITIIAAHPANHAGASGGWNTAPLPRTSTFNKYVWGHEIVYPGTQPMTSAQYRTMLIVSKIGVDIWGYGDLNRIKLHQGTSVTGKWDTGYASGRTYDINAIRNDIRALKAAPPPAPPEEEDVEPRSKYQLVKAADSPHIWEHNPWAGTRQWIQTGEELELAQFQIRNAGGNDQVVVVGNLNRFGIPVGPIPAQ